MKVLLLNGSPHLEGCTWTALCEVQKALESCGVETELMQSDVNRPLRGCIGCAKCAESRRCIFTDDAANRIIEAIAQADGLVIGSPVYYASANGAFTALLDRVFFAGGRLFSHKPAAAIISARRGGTTASMDHLCKYFTISQMPIVSSTYWNMVHGNSPEEVRQDLEGLQTMRNLGRNMAWLLGCIDAGRAAGLPLPRTERENRTNFIR